MIVLQWPRERERERKRERERERERESSLDYRECVQRSACGQVEREREREERERERGTDGWETWWHYQFTGAVMVVSWR